MRPAPHMVVAIGCQFRAGAGANGLAALWRVPFDHLARYAIHNFRSFSRLCGGPYRPLSFYKLVRPHQPPAVYANFKGAKGAIAAQYPPPTFLAS